MVPWLSPKQARWMMRGNWDLVRHWLVRRWTGRGLTERRLTKGSCSEQRWTELRSLRRLIRRRPHGQRARRRPPRRCRYSRPPQQRQRESARLRGVAGVLLLAGRAGGLPMEWTEAPRRPRRSCRYLRPGRRIRSRRIVAPRCRTMALATHCSRSEPPQGCTGSFAGQADPSAGHLAKPRHRRGGSPGLSGSGPPLTFEARGPGETVAGIRPDQASAAVPRAAKSEGGLRCSRSGPHVPRRAACSPCRTDARPPMPESSQRKHRHRAVAAGHAG